MRNFYLPRLRGRAGKNLALAWLLLLTLALSPLATAAVKENDGPPDTAQTDNNAPTTNTDGSLQIYELRNDTSSCGNGGAYKSGFFSSNDGGLTWQERGQQFNSNNIISYASAFVDARSVYLLVAGPVAQSKQVTYSIYFSSDAGVSWEKRYQSNEKFDSACVAYARLQLVSLTGRTTPVDALAIRNLTRLGGSTGSDYTVQVSVDGARNFQEIGIDNSPFHSLDYYYTPEGLIRYSSYPDAALTLSRDGGKSWLAITLPDYRPTFTCNALLCAYNVLTQPPNAPGSLFFYSKTFNIISSERKQTAVWYSGNLGRNWQKIADGVTDLRISDYAPTTIEGTDQNGQPIKTIAPDPDRLQTSRANFNKVAGGLYFDQTGHNLYGIFKSYWEANGGLAQFGLPWTEPFKEYNPADGKVYIVQYFERNRFEYHPENKGTRYEVLLGLLGNQLTEQRRAAGDGAFNRFPDMHYPGGIYFGETGHNLRNSFKDYWLANGGLTIYGYPTSEEFYEVNPDDGKTYVVQYFERNRLEYHPENKGTRYEVLLGLLGNTLLKQRGWL